MSTAFVSYARDDRPDVDQLCGDLRKLGHDVWLDEDLRVGEEWWNVILGQIRSCDVFIWAMTPAALESGPCRAELAYATAVAKTVVPIAVKPVLANLAPPEIGVRQILDYTSANSERVFSLAKEMNGLPPAAPLPDPLPTPPPIPMSYLGDLMTEISGPNDISSSRQHEIIDYLAPIAKRVEFRSDSTSARELLSRLLDRSDVTVSNAARIREIVAPQRDQTGSTTSPDPIPAPPQKQPVTQPAGDQLPTARRATGVPGEPWPTSTVALLVIGSLVSCGLAGIVGGLLGLGDPAKNSQAKKILWFSVILLVAFIVYAVIYAQVKTGK